MIPTPHINAKRGDFADTVLMPGDPCALNISRRHFWKTPPS